MMSTRITALGPALLLLAMACTRTEGTSEQPTRSTASESPAAMSPATFVDRVWRIVGPAEAEHGALRVFLSEGTLVSASSNSRPALGSWTRMGEAMTITEEGIDYPVEILHLSDCEFHIRIDGPGDPVEIELVPAAEPGCAE